MVDVEGNILSPGKSDGNDGGGGGVPMHPMHPIQGGPIPMQSGAIPKQENPMTNGYPQRLKKEEPSKMKKQQKVSPNKFKRGETSEALSPLVAECARAVFAAFVWHEGIVHDAMACSSFLKFNRTQRSQIMKHVTKSWSLLQIYLLDRSKIRSQKKEMFFLFNELNFIFLK
uniref:Uncharacterized protein n=1 Tax=Ciona savignyi TaxID=51511 RepID=H2YTW5_CIOSA